MYGPEVTSVYQWTIQLQSTWKYFVCISGFNLDFNVLKRDSNWLWIHLSVNEVQALEWMYPEICTYLYIYIYIYIYICILVKMICCLNAERSDHDLIRGNILALTQWDCRKQQIPVRRISFNSKSYPSNGTFSEIQCHLSSWISFPKVKKVSKAIPVTGREGP
jgi:hypothetical protein